MLSLDFKPIICTEDNYSKYTFKRGDFNGIGKWYMGREIAYVMGFQGLNGWRGLKEKEEDVTTLIENEISPNDTIADIGAGSRYHVFKMAPLAKRWFGLCC